MGNKIYFIEKILFFVYVVAFFLFFFSFRDLQSFFDPINSFACLLTVSVLSLFDMGCIKVFLHFLKKKNPIEAGEFVKQRKFIVLHRIKRMILITLFLIFITSVVVAIYGPQSNEVCGNCGPAQLPSYY